MQHRTITLKNRKKISSSGNGYCDICKERHFLSEHHIHGRNIPKPNHPSNLCYICDNCHRLTHEGIIVVEGWFKTTDGTELIYHNNNENSLSGNDARPYTIERK